MRLKKEIKGITKNGLMREDNADWMDDAAGSNVEVYDTERIDDVTMFKMRDMEERVGNEKKK